MSFTLLDTKEEICLISLLRCAADGEAHVEMLRQNLCEFSQFEPYQLFKSLQSDSLKCQLTLEDLSEWVMKQSFKTTILTDHELVQALQPLVNDSDLSLRYEGFLKLLLPRDNPPLRSVAMTRHDRSNSIARDVGYTFVRLLEQEGQVHSELMLRRRRLMDNAAKSALKQDIAFRSFRWLQSEASVPGMTHISPVAFRMLLHDTMGAFSVDQVESVFRRINVSGSGMLSYSEWENFLSTKHVDEFLSNVFLAQFATKCPGCGVHVQRDGGACPQVTCAYCRSAFSCVTNVDGSLYGDEKSYVRPIRETVGRDSMRVSTSPVRSSGRETSVPQVSTIGTRVSTPQARISRAESPARMSDRPSSPYRSSLSANDSPYRSSQLASSIRPSTAIGFSPQRSFMSESSPRRSMGESSPMSPSRFTARSSVSTNASPRDVSRSSQKNSKEYRGGVRDLFSTFGDRMESRKSERHDHLPIVLDVMDKQIDIDRAINQEKQGLQRLDVTPEAAFALLDRYKKGYIADTDIWQFLHDEGSPGPVSFSGVCSLYREQKPHSAEARKEVLGKLNLAELVHLLSPAESEEVKHVKRDMSDDETRSVLYTLRNTAACPECGIRVQRSIEGCPSVKCAMCFTSFRCTKIEDDPTTLHAWHEEKKWHVSRLSQFSLQKALKSMIELSEDAERLRKSLTISCGTDSVSTMILESFIKLSDDKGFFDLVDVKRKMTEHGLYRSQKDFDTLGRRYSQGRNRISFPDFADQLRPYSAQPVSVY